jgi:hypothetical protein
MVEAPYSVRLWPDGKCDLTGYRKVYARSPKDAAEKLYGGPLSEIGSMTSIRAQVRHGMMPSSIIFYEPLPGSPLKDLSEPQDRRSRIRAELGTLPPRQARTAGRRRFHPPCPVGTPRPLTASAPPWITAAGLFAVIPDPSGPYAAPREQSFAVLAAGGLVATLYRPPGQTAAVPKADRSRPPRTPWRYRRPHSAIERERFALMPIVAPSYCPGRRPPLAGGGTGCGGMLIKEKMKCSATS